MKNLVRQPILLAILVLLSLTGSTQNPIFSATQNWLTGVNQGTCMQRARETMLKNGFSANHQSDNVSFIGSKEAYNAYVICQSCQDKVITTIVLSTSRNVNEATELRERMLRYIATGGDEIINQGSPVNLVTTKKTFSSNEKITVEFSGMAGFGQDWISVIERTRPDNQAGTWKYTEGKKAGTLVFDPLPAGEYEARAFFNNSYTVEKRYPFIVQGIGDPGGNTGVTSQQLKIDKTNFIVGERLTVRFFGLPGNTNDWIAVSEQGKPETQSVQWLYTEGKKDGMLVFNGLPAGNYEARLFYNNSYKLEDKISFTVIPPRDGDFIIRTEKTVFLENEPIKVFFSNSQGSGQDWVSVGVSGKPDNQYGQWFYKGPLSAGDMSFTGLAVGDYDIRYYPNNGYEVKKRIQIKVVKP